MCVLFAIQGIIAMDKIRLFPIVNKHFGPANGLRQLIIDILISDQNRESLLEI